jgi:hypothetical protein
MIVHYSGHTTPTHLLGHLLPNFKLGKRQQHHRGECSWFSIVPHNRMLYKSYYCLTDMPWREAPGCVLLIDHATDFEAAEPAEMKTTRAISRDAAASWKSRGILPFVVLENRKRGLYE